MTTCKNCHKPILLDEAGIGMNLPGITDGPVYWCKGCISYDYRDIVNSIADFMLPPIELSEEDCEYIRKHGMDFGD